MSAEEVRHHSLKANFVFNFISQILTLIIPLITTPYLSRILHETGNGQISYSLSIITYFSLFANLGFDIYGQRQIAHFREDPDEKSKLFWELFFLKCIFTGISLIVLYSVTFGVGFNEPYTSLILIASVQVVAVPFDVQFFFRGEEDFATIAVRSIFMRVFFLVCIFLFVKNETHTWIYTLILSISAIASNLIMWPSVFRKVKFIFPGRLTLRKHLIPSLLIFLPTLAVTVYSVFDKTMIGLLAQNPDYENGCYEQAYKINSVALLIVTIISPVMVSRNAHDFGAENFESVKAHIRAASNYVWMMGTPLIVGFFVLSKNLSSWFLGEGYVSVPLLLNIMSIRFIVSGMAEVFGSQLFTAIKKEKYSMIAALAAAVVNVGMNYFLIPKYGAVGAAIATAVCEFTVTAILFILAAKMHYVSPVKFFLSSWKYLLSAAVMFVPIFFMQKYLGYSVWTFFLITLVGAVTYFACLAVMRDQFFMKQLKSIFKWISEKFHKKRVQNAGSTADVESQSESDDDQNQEGGENNV